MSEHDPYETAEEREARAQEAADQRRLAEAAQEVDIVWLTSGPRGRRIARRMLREAGIDLETGDIRSTFAANYGQMCFQEGLRVNGLRLLGRLLQALAHGEMKLETLSLLMSESSNA